MYSVHWYENEIQKRFGYRIAHQKGWMFRGHSRYNDIQQFGQ